MSARSANVCRKTARPARFGKLQLFERRKDEKDIASAISKSTSRGRPCPLRRQTCLAIAANCAQHTILPCHRPCIIRSDDLVTKRNVGSQIVDQERTSPAVMAQVSPSTKIPSTTEVVGIVSCEMRAPSLAITVPIFFCGPKAGCRVADRINSVRHANNFLL